MATKERFLAMTRRDISSSAVTIRQNTHSPWHHSRQGECVFCRMVTAELEISRRVIAKNRSFVAIAPFASRLPYEVWIVPRAHQESFDMITDPELEEFALMLREVLGAYRDKFGDPPYNYYIHSAPTDGTEYPYYHWHME